MLRVEVYEDGRVVLDLSGEVMEIVVELGTAINAIYNRIRMGSSEAGTEFKAAVQFLALGGPMWEERDLHGGFNQVIAIPKVRPGGTEASDGQG